MAKLGPAPRFLKGGGADAPLSFSLAIKIVTPVLGGGYENGSSDTLTPVRSSAIRGMLRWWWRATMGAACKDSLELHARESDIWGATDRQSKVFLEVTNGQLAAGIDALRNENGRNVFEQPAYALFPAQSNPSRKIHKSGSFTLHLRFPAALRKDVETALRAWIWFGGVGARTRRGLGSLFAPSDPRFQPGPGLMEFIKGLPRPECRQWSTLSGSSYLLGAKTTPLQAWNQAVDIYKDYRQNRQGNPGRSRWQEPDAIRRLRGTTDRRHSQPMTTEDVFPRAQFGLPIVFHFKDARTGDPQDNTLELGGDSDRMASPVLTKALVLSETVAFPLLVALRGPAVPQQLVLKQSRERELTVQQGGVDAIEYLLLTAERNWNTKRKSFSA